MAIAVPNEYGYVLAAATSTFFVNALHSMLTAKHRRAASIKYPNAYATAEQAEKDPKAFAFNCAQRAHANFTEHLTPFLGSLLIAGLKSPVYAAGLGATWSVGRVVYALGYTKKGPRGREAGYVVSLLSDLALKIMAVYVSLGFALGW